MPKMAVFSKTMALVFTSFGISLHKASIRKVYLVPGPRAAEEAAQLRCWRLNLLGGSVGHAMQRISWANYHEWFASSDPSECQKKSKSFTSTYTLCPFKRFAYLSLVFKVVPSAISVQLTVLPKPRKTKHQKQCQSGRSAVLAVDSHWSKFEALPPKSPACRPLNQQLPSS